MLTRSFNLKYEPYNYTLKKNLFQEEFFTSVDCKISIDEVETTNISAIEYTVTEPSFPLFGYASKTFDDVAIGARTVSGTIVVPVSNYDKTLHDFTKEWLPKIRDNGGWKTNENGDIEWTSSFSKNSPRSDMPDSERDKATNRKPLFPVETDSFFDEKFEDKYANVDTRNGVYRYNYKDIKIEIGNNEDKRVKILKCVVFGSSALNIDASGQTISETIAFMARDIVENDKMYNDF